MTTVAAAVTVRATFASNPVSQHILDVDGNTHFDPLTDGLLVMRYLFGITGPELTDSAIGTGNPPPTRTLPAEIAGYLQDIEPYLDADLNGEIDPLTDGLLIFRYLSGIRGDALKNSTLAPDASRTSATDIANYLDTLVQ